MKRKVIFCIAMMLSYSLLFSACGQKLISEEQAKEIALKTLDQVFDTELTAAEATIALMEHPRTVFENNEVVKKEQEKNIRYYSVSVSDEKGVTQYAAEVDAITGTVSYLYKNEMLVELTDEQKEQAAALGTFEEFSADRFSKTQKDAANAAVAWVQQKMDSQTDIDHATTNEVYTDAGLFPTVMMDSFITMKSGVVYHTSVCWPALQVVNIEILNQKS